MAALPDVASRAVWLVTAPTAQFSLPSPAAPGTLRLWLNGLRLPPEEYILAEDAINVVLSHPAEPGDTVGIRYKPVPAGGA